MGNTLGGRSGDLPGELTSFVGREAEVAAAKRLLAQSSLVTLTGPGGVGKTRIALRVAADVRANYADGVCLVELSALQDTELLTYTVTAALGLSEQTARPAIDVLIEYLKDRRLLLVLDTCEHIADECARVADVLRRGAPGLSILATSRQPLNSAGEHTLSIPPMPVPDDDEPFGKTYDSVALFAERAAAVVPRFVVSQSNWPAVAQVCRQLDGIPLAIELAVVRLRALSLEQMVSLLSDRFLLLIGGVRTAVPRHQTLRTAIGWSHELCTPEERLLWARLSVFAGDFDLPAAERICASSGLAAHQVFERLIDLVDKSIVNRVESDLGTRYRLLDTVREYGKEWLTALCEEDEFRRRHRDFYGAMAERFDAGWLGAGQVRWCHRLRQEHPNLRVALEFCFTEECEAEAGLAMVTALWGYWLSLARFSEARYWLNRALQLVPDPLPVRARALWLSGWFGILQGDYASSGRLLEECRALAEEHHDEPAMAFAEQYLGCLNVLQGNVDQGLILYEDALARLRKLEHRPGLMILLFQLGFMYILAGEVDRGVAACDESLMLNTDGDERCIRGYALYAKSLGYWMRGEYAECADMAGASMRMRHEIGDLMGVASGLETLSWVAAEEQRYRHAAYLMGAAKALWEKIGTPLFGVLEIEHEKAERRVRHALGQRGYEEVFRAGTALTVEQAVNRAIWNGPPSGTDQSGESDTTAES